MNQDNQQQLEMGWMTTRNAVTEFTTKIPLTVIKKHFAALRETFLEIWTLPAIFGF